MSALAAMIQKLDERNPSSGGYVTDAPEVRALLTEGELTDRIPASVIETYRDDDLLSVEVTIHFSVSRAELAEAPHAH